MAEPKKKLFDVWFIRSNTVYKEVPYRVVTDWVQQARLDADDMLKPNGGVNWVKVSALPLFQAYLPQPEEQKVNDVAEALEPIELDFNWKKRHADDDDDVDMIPLIDISLVLLIFFMMTTSIAAVSRINVPSSENAAKIDTSLEILRVDIDMANPASPTPGAPIYDLATGTAAPLDEDANLHDLPSLFARLDKVVDARTHPPKVRIAAHAELPYSVVEDVMKQLEQRRTKGKIEEYHIEVNERAKR